LKRCSNGGLQLRPFQVPKYVFIAVITWIVKYNNVEFVL